MTVVIGLLTDKYVVFAADNRRVNTEDISEYYDDMRKHYRVNDRVIVGFSGDYNETVACIQFLQTHDKEDSYVEDIAELLRGFLADRLKDDADLQQTVFIGGVGKDDKMTLITTSHREGYEIEQLTPEAGHFLWNLAYANESPHDHIQAAINDLSEKDEVLTVDKVKEIAAESIRKVSETDAYVSATYDLDYITL